MKRDINAKEVIETILGGDIGTIIEIRKTFTNYSKYIISELPYLLLRDNAERELIKALRNANPYKKKDPYEDKQSVKVLCLLGIHPFIDEATNLPSVHSISTNDMNLLMELISLVREPIDWANLHKSFNNEEIINWCKKYALPLCGANDVNEYKNDKLQIVYSYNILDSFYLEITTLYILFNLWKSNEYNESTAKKYASSLVTIRQLNHYDYRKILTYFINHKMKYINMNFSINSTNQLHLDTDSILSMCYFQLASLITKPIEESKNHLKICKGCLKLKWMAHGNSCYCENCNRKTEWSRRNKKSKKAMEE